MVEYSYQQKIAMMRILLDIIHADGYIDAREQYFFKELKELFNLEEADHESVKECNSLLALLQIRDFTEEQKMGFALYMSKMVAIYNVVNEFCAINKEFAANIPQEELKGYTHS